MGREPPGRGKGANKAIIEHNWKGAQGDGGQERHTVVRLAPEEEGRDQPVPKGKNTIANDGVDTKAGPLNCSHDDGSIRMASSGCARAVVIRNVREDAGNIESHGQHAQGETHEPHQHQPVAIQARVRLASWLEAFGKGSRCGGMVHRCPPSRLLWLLYRTRRDQTGADRVERGLGAALHAQFGEDSTDM